MQDLREPFADVADLQAGFKGFHSEHSAALNYLVQPRALVGGVWQRGAAERMEHPMPCHAMPCHPIPSRQRCPNKPQSPSELGVEASLAPRGFPGGQGASPEPRLLLLST